MNLDNSVISKVKNAFQSKEYQMNFINQITFPQYKNLKPFSIINFEHPYTAFIGNNGLGKSATLHALYGCPKQKSTGDFWFSTTLDPIEETGGNPHCYYYRFFNRSTKTQDVVLKTRVKRSGARENPDYWETSRPLSKYGIGHLKRKSPIEKNVIYIDFRAQLSAFDQYFYFSELNKSLRSKTKQDYIRNKSSYLYNAIVNDKEMNSNGVKQNNKPYSFRKEEIETINFILGKKYISGKIISHKFFGSWSTSVIFEEENLKYSEAHAGSGEVAVANLIYRVYNAPSKSLILLDEPEVSLHPRAQKHLKLFLLNLILKNKHQIVLSTHSPIMVEELPRESIKIFQQDGEHVEIVENSYANEAFLSIGQAVENKLNITVEDDLARKIIETVIRDKFTEIQHDLFNVRIYPGGAKTIINNSFKESFVEKRTNDFLFLDGDQRPQENGVIELEKLSKANYTQEKLMSIVTGLTNINKINFPLNGNSKNGANEEVHIKYLDEFIYFYDKNVYFLPGKIPENIIMDKKLIMKHAKSILNPKKFAEFSSEFFEKPGDKNKIHFAAVTLYNQAENPNDAFEMYLINSWLSKKDENYSLIFEGLEEMYHKYNQVAEVS